MTVGIEMGSATSGEAARIDLAKAKVAFPEVFAEDAEDFYEDEDDEDWD